MIHFCCCIAGLEARVSVALVLIPFFNFKTFQWKRLSKTKMALPSQRFKISDTSGHNQNVFLVRWDYWILLAENIIVTRCFQPTFNSYEAVVLFSQIQFSQIQLLSLFVVHRSVHVCDGT